MKKTHQPVRVRSAVAMHRSSRLQKASCSGCLSCGALPCGLSIAGVQSMPQIHSHYMVRQGGQIPIMSDPGRVSILVVMEGWVKLFSVLDDGRYRVHGFFAPNSRIIVDPERENLLLGALTPARICRLSQEQIVDLGNRVPAVNAWLLLALMQAEINARRAIDLIREQSAANRVWRFLSDLADGDHTTGAPRVISLRMTRDDIGAYLNMSSETVSRCFSSLQEQGMITILARRRIALTAAPPGHVPQSNAPIFQTESDRLHPNHSNQNHLNPGYPGQRPSQPKRSNSRLA